MKTNYRFIKRGDYGVILTHGLCSSISSSGLQLLEKMFNALGYSTISFDMYGHGFSDGNISELTLSDCYSQILEMNRIFIKENILCKMVYGTSFSTLPVLKFGNEIESVDKIFLKTPVFNYSEKRLKELGVDMMKKWEKEGVIEIMKSENGRPAIYQNYEFLIDFEKEFISTFRKNKKHLVLGAGIFDSEVSIDELRKISSSELISIFEYQSSHRFSSNDMSLFVLDIQKSIL